MQQPIGELIRQARRQRNLTQTELGGDRFSKSYVSAVERNKIVSSAEALKFFAEQLGQSDDYFTTLLKHSQGGRQLSVVGTSHVLGPQGQSMADKTATLLDILLQNTEFSTFPIRHEFPLLSSDVITALAPDKQARYYFLMGLIAKDKKDLTTALSAFETALILAPSNEQASILDELGRSYYLGQAYQTALSYHLRALHLLQHKDVSNTTAPLQFKLNLHCGDDYRALGMYQQSLEQYEQARLRLNSTYDIKTVGLLYFGLGYCTYALISQRSAPSTPAEVRATPEEMEREFQRAISFLLQSRSVYQVSGDCIWEASVRVTLAAVLLGFSMRRRQVAQEKTMNTGKASFINCTPLLDDAEEQCRQALLDWQAQPSHGESPPAELETLIYIALACLIRVSTQRAALARLGGYVDTAYRERAFAAYLCQQVLDTFAKKSLPWSVIQDVLSLSVDNVAYRPPSLPRLPDPSPESKPIQRSLLSQVEVFIAAGEVAEELGRAATVHGYARDCYVRANLSFQAALSMAQSVILEGERDPGYLTRYYLRCISLLEERAVASPTLYEETIRTLLSILKDGLWYLRYPSMDKTMFAQISRAAS